MIDGSLTSKQPNADWSSPDYYVCKIKGRFHQKRYSTFRKQGCLTFVGENRNVSSGILR